MDVICVYNKSNDIFSCTDFDNIKLDLKQEKNNIKLENYAIDTLSLFEWVDIYCNGCLLNSVKSIINNNKIVFIEGLNDHLIKTKDNNNNINNNLIFSNTPSSKIIKLFNLNKGKNIIKCCHNKSNIFITFCIYLYDSNDRLLVCDIDGTITKSDIRGYFETVYLNKYNYLHKNIIEFLCYLENNHNIKIIYITARSRDHFQITRIFLDKAKQLNLSLPSGPLFTTKTNLFNAALNEIFHENAIKYKSSTLITISNIFKSNERNDKIVSPFVMGIGNKITDCKAYSLSGIPNSSILLINTKSCINIWSIIIDKDNVKYRYKKCCNCYNCTNNIDTKMKDDDKEESVSIIPINKFNTYGDILLLNYIDDLLKL
jgi:phosphatidate phosphatase PAH1